MEQTLTRVETHGKSSSTSRMKKKAERKRAERIRAQEDSENLDAFMIKSITAFVGVLFVCGFVYKFLIDYFLG